MKKRLLTFVLSLGMAMCSAFALTACGEKKTECEKNGHSFSTEWLKDATEHWHNCANCDEISDKAAHVYDNDADTTCNVCGYERPAHTHQASTEWLNDDTQHWHECTANGCNEQLDKAAHTWNEGEVTTPATEATDGERTFTCTVCGRTKTESISAFGYTVTFDSQGGSAVASITKDAGEAVTAPADPERTGFVFLGWYADKDKSVYEGATPYVFDKMPENNVTLYAKWALNLTVSYEGQDAVTEMIAFSVTEANEDVTFAFNLKSVTEIIGTSGTYMGFPMKNGDNNGLDTEIATENGKYVSALYNEEMENVYAEGDYLYRYGAGDFYSSYKFAEAGNYYLSVKFATPGEYTIGAKALMWKHRGSIRITGELSSGKKYDGQAAEVSFTADDYEANSNGAVTVKWYDASKNSLSSAPVNVGNYYYRLFLNETDEVYGAYSDYVAYKIDSAEITVNTPYNFTYNGNTLYYVDYSTSAVNGEKLMAYFSFINYDGVIELDDYGFEVWGDVTEKTSNYAFVYKGSGDIATLNKKTISDLSLHVIYNGTTSFTGITGSKATSTDIINEYDVNDFEKLIFSVATTNKNASDTAYTISFANVVIGGDAAAFYTLAESGNANVFIDKKELKNLSLTTTKKWTAGGSVEITLTEKDGICAEDVVTVTISNGNYQ
ncbi:MAG: InlB B-repeat-containing protein, partial [Candidatus Scatosoma sp.]